MRPLNARCARLGSPWMLMLLALVGCPEDPKQQPATTVTPPPTASSARRAKPPGPRLRPAKPKETKATTEEDLGTLPEGVGIAVGEKAPAFSLKDQSGAPRTLADLQKRGTVLLVFYRGGW